MESVDRKPSWRMCIDITGKQKIIVTYIEILCLSHSFLANRNEWFSKTNTKRPTSVYWTFYTNGFSRRFSGCLRPRSGTTISRHNFTTLTRIRDILRVTVFTAFRRGFFFFILSLFYRSAPDGRNR